jgi:dTDP-4-dehydrorhamnose 3,5-epimerase
MEVKRFETEGPMLLTAVRHYDDRGFFTELFKSSQALELGLPSFVQENLSRSGKGVVRGLHWQTEPMSQGKLVSCISGKIVDYFVDIRSSSPTFGKAFSAELSSESTQWLWVPAGFAHGFESLEEDTVVVYKVTNPWSKDHERSLSPLDPSLGITFISNSPLLSEKDAAAPLLNDLSQDSLFN